MPPGSRRSSSRPIVTWEQIESAGSSVWANRFDIQSGWGEATELDSDEGGLYSLALAGNGRGDAVALTTTSEQLFATRFVQGEGWETPTPVGSPGEALGPFAGMDEQGNIIAAWTTGPGLWASRFTPGSGWSEPERMDASDGVGGGHTVALDANGNALVAWPQDGGIHFRRYTVGDGWSGPSAIAADDSLSGFDLAIASSPGGRAVLSWQYEFSIGGAVFR